MIGYALRGCPWRRPPGNGIWERLCGIERLRSIEMEFSGLSSTTQFCTSSDVSQFDAYKVQQFRSRRHRWSLWQYKNRKQVLELLALNSLEFHQIIRQCSFLAPVRCVGDLVCTIHHQVHPTQLSNDLIHRITITIQLELH